MHLTNYSVNKKSTQFVSNIDAGRDDEGSKWSLTALWKHLRGLGVDVEALRARIQDIAVKTLIAAGGCPPLPLPLVALRSVDGTALLRKRKGGGSPPLLCARAAQRASRADDQSAEGERSSALHRVQHCLEGEPGGEAFLF